MYKGKSAALDMLSQSKVKGREGARKQLDVGSWSSDNWRLCSDINKARKNIESAMDERRRLIEVAKARKFQAADKYRTISENLKKQQGGSVFTKQAVEEVLQLQKIGTEIQHDKLKQRIRAERDSAKTRSIIAPPGYANRKGKSQVGPVLGPGPLPPNATSSLRDPRVESTVQVSAVMVVDDNGGDIDDDEW